MNDTMRPRSKRWRSGEKQVGKYGASSDSVDVMSSMQGGKGKKHTGYTFKMSASDKGSSISDWK